MKANKKLLDTKMKIMKLWIPYEVRENVKEPRLKDG